MRNEMNAALIKYLEDHLYGSLIGYRSHPTLKYHLGPEGQLAPENCFS